MQEQPPDRQGVSYLAVFDPEVCIMRVWLHANAVVMVGLLLLPVFAAQSGRTEEPPPFDDAAIEAAMRVFGLDFNRSQRDSLRQDLEEQREGYELMRQDMPDNAVASALRFDPLFWHPGKADSLARAARAPGSEPIWRLNENVVRPADAAELAWLPVTDLAVLLRTRQVTSIELTRLALDRLRTHDPVLQCVVTFLEDRALERALLADHELDAGRWRGPLHGVPCGVKDLLAMPGHRTTWGATPYRDQERPEMATVAARLDSAGAVIVAKLTLGALAWGDVWFGGVTRNPWNPEQGSSGSSAGSASAVAAGLVPFAIGSETLGSIVSPSTRCGVTGLRPTFGRVSRHGAMALSWSMDKLGPIARTVEDCAIVLHAIQGPDGLDPTVIDAPLPVRPGLDPSMIRVGYLADFFEDDENARGALDRAVLEVMREAGFALVPVSLPEREVAPLGTILTVEAAAAFQELTLSGRDSLLVRQIRNAWPNVFRAAAFVPAVEYVQANRQRLLLMREFEAIFDSVDVYVTPSYGGQGLLMTNLTGHPQIVVPSGFAPDGAPWSVSFVGRLFGEAELVAVARAYQQHTDWHLRRPAGFQPG
jgi:Asp-tRNA(Asn)/Glu-tRNA(Gln) amidotransferase A subunit family amidase